MILEVREATPSEVAVAVELSRRAETARTGVGSSDDDARAFAESMSEAAAKPSARLLVGLHSGRVVATIFGIRLRNDATKAQVAMLAVEPDLWGCGVGSRMLTELMQCLSDGGCNRLRMNVLPDNGRARALYERHGWTHDGETEQVVRDAEPELIYRYTAYPAGGE